MAQIADELTTFAYTAVTDQGVRVEEKMQAPTQADVVVALQRAGYTPLHIRKVGGFHAANVSDIIGTLNKKPPKMKANELAAFTRQLHQLLRAGIPISGAMTSLAEDQEDPAIGEMLRTIADRIVSGTPLSQSFQGYPKVFHEVFVAYMSAGETSGDLPEVTFRLSQILDKRAEIQNKVKAVTMYPKLVAGAIFIMLVAIIMFLVPRFTKIYANFDAALPTPTQWVVTLSHVFPIVAAIAAIAIAAFVYYNKAHADDLEFGTKYDRLRFRLPVFGHLAQLLALYRWASTLGGTTAAGIQTYDALDLAARASASRWIRAITHDLQEAVQTGRTLSSQLAQYPELFQARVRKMVATGEETGDFSEMLIAVSASMDDEIDVLISTMSAKIEVALLMFMGASVGTILIALYLPILKLSTTIGKKYGF